MAGITLLVLSTVFCGKLDADVAFTGFSVSVLFEVYVESWGTG
jgi:multisubunit Na+/H+ antiporter MnhB subunit